MSIHTAPLAELQDLVGASSSVALARATALVPEAPELMRQLVERDYPAGEECEQAVELVRAFGALLTAVSTASLTVEFYDDPDHSPLLWEFVWGETEGSDPFQLPLSPHGAPAIAYRDARAVSDFAARFGSAQAAGTLPSTAIAHDELAALVALLQASAASDAAVWVYREY